MKRLLGILFALVTITAAAEDSIPAMDLGEVPEPLTVKKHTQQKRLTVPRWPDGTRIYADTAIYQGMNIKLDLAMPIIEIVRSKGKIQNYEIATNMRLKNRFYPTLELGCARAEAEAGGGHHFGQGGFVRVGVDINPFKKNLSLPSYLAVGIRIGTAVQQFSLTGVTINDPYWGGKTEVINQVRPDVWGEVVAGVQVQIWAGLHLGWYLRYKFLFTEYDKKGAMTPYYIPGFGYRQSGSFGANYYIGWKF